MPGAPPGNSPLLALDAPLQWGRRWGAWPGGSAAARPAAAVWRPRQRLRARARAQPRIRGFARALRARTPLPPGWGACPTGARPRLLRPRHLGACGPGGTSLLALASKCGRPGLAGAPPSLGRPHLVSFYPVDSELCSAWLRLRAAHPLHAVREPHRAWRLGRVCARRLAVQRSVRPCPPSCLGKPIGAGWEGPWPALLGTHCGYLQYFLSRL